MVSIILSANDRAKAEALAAGFKEQTVLIRYDAVQSSSENFSKREAEMRAMRPNQFLAADFWGACPE